MVDISGILIGTFLMAGKTEGTINLDLSQDHFRTAKKLVNASGFKITVVMQGQVDKHEIKVTMNKDSTHIQIDEIEKSAIRKEQEQGKEFKEYTWNITSYKKLMNTIVKMINDQQLH